MRNFLHCSPASLCALHLALFISMASFVTPASAEETATVLLTLGSGGFEPKELRIPAGKPVILTVKNESAAAAEFESKDLKVEKVVAAGSQIIVRLKPLTKGRYLFVDEYREATVKGYVVVE